MKRVLFVIGALCASVCGQSCPPNTDLIETSYGSYCRSRFSGVRVQTSIPIRDDLSIDCSKQPEKSGGCNSYNEMIKGGDKDLLSTLKSDNNTFVCFRPYEDVFFMVSYDIPSYLMFVKNEVSKLFEARGLIWYSRYKQGVLDDSRLASGKWLKYARDGLAPYFVPDPKSISGSEISESEIAFGYTFQNLSNTKTAYRLEIRHSTLRFVETYQWDNPARTKSKKKGGDAAEEEPTTQGTNDISGHCVFFPSHAP